MELENLRTIWRTGMAQSPAPAQTDLEILSLLSRRSRGAATKMKRNLFGELILVLAIYTPAIFFYLFGFGRKLSEMGWVLLVLMLFFAGYYYRKNRLLNEMQCVSCRVRSNLERQVAALRKYIRFYTLAGTILVPVMAVFSFLIANRNLLLLSPGFGSSPPGGAHWWKSISVWAMALASVTVVTYFANTWYMNKLYGRHIKRLQNLLQEMN